MFFVVVLFYSFPLQCSMRSRVSLILNNQYKWVKKLPMVWELQQHGTDTPDPQLGHHPLQDARQMQLHTAPTGITKINRQPGHSVPRAIIIREAGQNKSIDFVWAGGWELRASGKTSVSLPPLQSQGF